MTAGAVFVRACVCASAHARACLCVLTRTHIYGSVCVSQRRVAAWSQWESKFSVRLSLAIYKKKSYSKTHDL